MTDLDQNTQALIAAHPYFHYRYEKARYLLTRTTEANGTIRFIDGNTTDGTHCTCQEGYNCACLHQLAWRIAHHDNAASNPTRNTP